MALGTWQKSDTAPPSNIDLRDLERFTFADGVSLREAWTFAQTAASAFNDNRIANAEVALVLDLLCAPPSPDQEIRYINGSVDWHNASEFGTPEFQRVSTAGAVVIPEAKTAALGVTWEGLRRTRSEDFIAAFGRFLDGAASVKRKSLLETIFTATTARVHPSGNGSKSPSWVGGGSQNYVPPTRNGVSFAADDHIDDNQADSDAGRLAAFKAMRDNLWEHGYYSEDGAPIILLHGPLTLADVKGVSGYVARKQAFIEYAPGGTTSYAANLGVDPFTFHGVWADGGVWCVQIGGIPDNYFAMVKSFGSRNPMNPIKTWVPQDIGGSLILRGLDPNPPEYASPIEKLVGHLEYGFGVQLPDAGAVSLIGGGGTYTDPTIT